MTLDIFAKEKVLLMSPAQECRSCSPSQPPTTESSSPFNDSALYRYSTLLAIKALKTTRSRKGSVLMLTDRLCVKYGPRVHLCESIHNAFHIAEYVHPSSERVMRVYTL